MRRAWPATRGRWDASIATSPTSASCTWRCLIHDLGKGFLEDHREIGLRIAQRTALRLGLPEAETERLTFLVHKHLRMNHLAFRRDTSDEETVVDFAVQVGSPEVLQMLFVLTAADLGAVGPDVWDGWKTEILTDLYHRTMQQLAGESPATTRDELFGQRLAEIRKELGPAADDPWFLHHVENLPSGYLNATAPRQVAADLQLLRGRTPGDVLATAQYLPETDSVLFTIGASEQITAGIFHKLTGALTSHGLEIRTRRSTRWPTGWCWTASGSTIRISPARRRRTAWRRSTVRWPNRCWIRRPSGRRSDARGRWAAAARSPARDCGPR